MSASDNFPSNTTYTFEAAAATEEQRAVIKPWLDEKNIDPTQVMAIEVRKTEFKGQVTWSGYACMYLIRKEEPNQLNPHGWARVLPGYWTKQGFWRPETELDHQLIALVGES